MMPFLIKINQTDITNLSMLKNYEDDELNYDTLDETKIVTNVENAAAL